uniref:Dual specificity protein phosphatase 14 n=1 Tax=Strongyloides papillosus TaxID=174720 RepID=A0A0N5CFB6_STREA
MPISFQVNPEYAQLTELVPGLFICGVSALTPDNMRKNKIGLIVNATEEVPNLKSLGDIARSKLWIKDLSSENIFSHLEPLADQIHLILADGGKVLVHCVAGVSRSATICLAYLTKYYCKNLREAYHLMCSKRPMVRPNLGFWRQLITFEQLIKRTAGSVRLVRDDAQSDNLLPDVYLPQVVPERPVSPENLDVRNEARARRNSGSSKKFSPVLEPVPEICEAAA